MPNNQQGFDLGKLKTDPQMWMRLAKPSKNGKYLENVFKDKENPFEKNYQAAVETMEKLAAEGKLYLRDFGRSRHFHKVEKTEDGLKLGDQHEMKLSNRTTDPVLGGLMWLSRRYFKWIGLDRISNWFDERLKQREAINKMQEQYKVEYKSLTSEEKAELKALRKHEENLKKIDKAKELSNETKKELDAIRGKETTETLEELEAMLAKAEQRSADNQSPEKQFARRALLDHEENLQKVGEARKDANEKKKTLDAIRGKETTETLEQLEQMLSNANQIEQRRGGPLSANERKARKALRDYVKSLRELEKTEKKAEGTKKKLDETLGRETTETVEQLWSMLSISTEEVNERRALRRHVENLRKLAEAEKKAEGTKKKLDETLGRKTTETIEQLKEMLGISPEEVNERRALRRHVENLRKLAKAEKKAEVTKQKLDEVQSKNNPKGPKEVESPLSKAPNTEEKTNTMQPTLLGDQPVQENKPVQRSQESNLVQQQTVQQEIIGEKKEAPQQKEKKSQLFINGVELTEETAKQFPPHIVEAFKLIQQMINEKEANEKGSQQPVQDQPTVTEENKVIEEPQITEDVKQNTEAQPQLTETEQQVNQPVETEEPVQKEGTLIDLDDFQQNVTEKNENVQKIDLAELEQIFSNNPNQPTVDEKIPEKEMTAPLKDGANLEPEKVNIQERHQDQAQTNQQERLAAEKAAMDLVANWKDQLANTLFSNEGVSTAKEYYGTIKDKPDGQELLAGTVCGLLSAAGDSESRQQIMEGVLSGKPLGNEHNSRINESVAAYHNAVERMSLGDSKPMTKLITDAALELGRQASQETSLSPRHVMIGRMISNAMSLAGQHELQLKFNDEQWATIRGAFELSKLAQRHHDAKQFLGQEPMDVSSKDGRNAVRDLLMGNAVENMIQTGKYHGQQVTDVQILMGCGCLTVDKLTKMMSASQIRNEITEERVKDIMEMPNGYDSARMAKRLGEELLTIAQEGGDNFEKSKQKELEKQNKPEKEQQVEAMPLMQPV